MSVPTGKNLLGRIVDPLGNVLDIYQKLIIIKIKVNVV